MEQKNKSKFIVAGFVLFVILTYTGSYFYTKDNNERLLSSPRLVMLVGSEETVNSEFESLNADEARIRIREMSASSEVFTITQQQYDAGTQDIAENYENDFTGDYVVANCMEYSEAMKRAVTRGAKNKVKTSWIFYACGIVE